MTEAEWLGTTDPMAMIKYTTGRLSDRKARLIRVAAARSVWPELKDEQYRTAVEVGERFADGSASDAERTAHARGLYAMFGAGGAFHLTPPDRTALEIHSLALSCVQNARIVQMGMGASWSMAVRHTRCILPAIIRDVAGNPTHTAGVVSTMLTPKVVTIAQQMYDARDFAAMPILADSLQDAGCEDEQILAHCRGAGPHVRGCWVVDGVLGKT